MPFCRKCGHEVGDSDKFCPSCGSSQQGIEAAAEAPQPQMPSPPQKRSSWPLVLLVLLVVGVGIAFVLVSSQRDRQVSCGEYRQAPYRQAQLNVKTDGSENDAEYYDFYVSNAFGTAELGRTLATPILGCSTFRPVVKVL